MKSELSALKEKIDEAFDQHKPRDAHAIAKDIFKGQQNNRKLLEEIILQNAESPGFFSQNRINPVVMLKIFETPKYSLIGHAWIPLPAGATEQTHQSIHHHGNLLLTSLSAYGPGYESILFKSGYKVDRETKEANLEVEKFYQNPQGNVEFINSHTPHVVFYPSKLSITYALWSPDSAPKASTIKQNKLLRKFRTPLKKIASGLGLKKMLGINDSEDLDFFLESKKIYVLRNRIMYPAGSNENFVRAFFYVLQNLDFAQNEKIKSAFDRQKKHDHAFAIFNDYWGQREIKNIFEPSHLNISKVNILRSDLLSCYPSLPHRGIVPHG